MLPPAVHRFAAGSAEAWMKVHVIGGGPAGLYFAILVKKAWPQTRITVFERNRPDDTFGFGVVFSDRRSTPSRSATARAIAPSSAISPIGTTSRSISAGPRTA